MKYLIILIILITLASCTSNIKNVAGFEFDNAWYWIITYSPEATEADLKDYTKLNANPNQTSYFFYYPEGTVLSRFENEAWNMKKLANSISVKKPTYGHYIMVADTTLYEDGVWLMEQVVSN